MCSLRASFICCSIDLLTSEAFAFLAFAIEPLPGAANAPFFAL